MMNSNTLQDEMLKSYIQTVFNKYDTDKNGSLDVHEMTQFFNDLFKSLNINTVVTEAQSLEAIKSIDDNSDGMVDRGELFKAFKLMLNPPQRNQPPPPNQGYNNNYSNPYGYNYGSNPYGNQGGYQGGYQNYPPPGNQGYGYNQGYNQGGYNQGYPNTGYMNNSYGGYGGGMGGGSMYNSQPRYPPNNFGNQYGSYNPYKR